MRSSSQLRDSRTPPTSSRGTPGGTRNRNNNGRDENEIEVTWTPPPNPLSWDNYIQTVFSRDSSSQLRDSRTPPTSSRGTPGGTRNRNNNGRG
nr:hypothetical protein [Tanacetum cinerariifolium]